MAAGKLRQFYARWSSLSLSQEEKLRLVALGIEHRIDRYTEYLDGSLDRLIASIGGRLAAIKIQQRGSSTPATDKAVGCSSPIGHGEASAVAVKRGGTVEPNKSELRIECGDGTVGVGASGLQADFAAFNKGDRLWGL